MSKVHNIDLMAERQVLGAAMQWPHLLDDLRLEPEHFHRMDHQLLWGWMQERYRSRQSVEMSDIVGDLLAMTEEQRAVRVGRLDVAEISGLPELAHPTAEATVHPAKRLRELSGRHALRLRLVQGAELLTEGSDSLEVAQEILARISEYTRRETDQESVGQVAERVDGRLVGMVEGSIQPYVPTGIRAWDEDQDFGGLSTEGMTLILARSNSGKTSFVNRLALGAAWSGVPVYLHGTETSRERRVEDLAFSLAQVDKREFFYLSKAVQEARERGYDDRRTREQAEGLLAQIRNGLDAVAQLPLYVSGAGLTVERITARARAHRLHDGIGLVLVDYLQDIEDAEGIDRSRTIQVLHSSGRLKNLAADLGIPVVVAAQVSGEKGGIPRGQSINADDVFPQQWDVEWASQAGKDAEEVYAMWLDSYASSRQEGWVNIGPANTIGIRARKRRIGKESTIWLDWHGPTKWVGDGLQHRRSR